MATTTGTPYFLARADVVLQVGTARTDQLYILIEVCVGQRSARSDHEGPPPCIFSALHSGHYDHGSWVSGRCSGI